MTIIIYYVNHIPRKTESNSKKNRITFQEKQNQIPRKTELHSKKNRKSFHMLKIEKIRSYLHSLFLTKGFYEMGS